jgi:hypothetical protein
MKERRWVGLNVPVERMEEGRALLVDRNVILRPVV